ncbi:hypothetical protein RRG08_003888 [Elysia crispata]|uniref:Inositol-pentakisphosphate 2-kinase n=1 Tax=Elysia crispata TaxID=231223 RepID=A0AAE1DEL4_9GAST|nr:hypothetical protein RRG08_003888 [Elysia crispata]
MKRKEDGGRGRDRERIKYSLHGLIKAPQHQLKICKNGKEVYGSEIRQDLSEILKDWFPEHTNCSDELLSKFLDLIIEVLLYSTKDNATIPAQKYSESHEISGRERRQMGAEGSDRDSVVGRVEPEPTRLVSNGQGGGQICGKSPFFSSSKARDTENKMPNGCVLECMSRLQQMDQLDIEDIFHLHSSLATKMMADPDLRKKWKWDGPFTDISWILRENYETADMCGNPIEEDVLKVKRFLVSKTLQDCSIIVAIKPVSGGRGSQRDDHCLSFHGVLYEFAVRIIDLDPKSFDKVPFYYYQAVDIVSAFEDLMH